MCEHTNAVCVESTTPKPEGEFTERYKCPCGATGRITGREEAPPSSWNRTGEVFNNY